MADLAHFENTLEKLITDHLTEHGWHEGNKSNYIREIGLDIEELSPIIDEIKKFTKAEIFIGLSPNYY